MSMKKLLFFFIFPILIHSQAATDDQEMDIKHGSKVTFGFRRYAEDKYFVGSQNPRSFLTRFSMITNFQLSNALLSRDPGSANRWYFPGVVLAMDARIATEIYVVRSQWVGMAAAGAIEIPMLARISPSTVNVYGVTGEAALIFDFFLPNNWRLRFIPLYHQSTHLADGYRGNTKAFDLLSYEFMALEVYKHWRWFSFYGGIEVTYNAPAERSLRMRIHGGIDFRFPIWREIGFLAGIHVAALWDDRLNRHPEAEGWHPAVNFGAGFEFSRVMIMFKVSHQRSFEAATYHYLQTKVGLEFSIFL